MYCSPGQHQFKCQALQILISSGILLLQSWSGSGAAATFLPGWRSLETGWCAARAPPGLRGGGKGGEEGYITGEGANRFNRFFRKRQAHTFVIFVVAVIKLVLILSFFGSLVSVLDCTLCSVYGTMLTQQYTMWLYCSVYDSFLTEEKRSCSPPPSAYFRVKYGRKVAELVPRDE